MHEGTDGVVHVETLTDEELAVLVGRTDVGNTPHLDGLAPGQRASAEHAAYRSLTARGVTARSDIRALVTLREAAQTIVSITRTIDGRRDFWYGRLVDGVLLVERVSSDGIHQFALADGERLGELVVRAAVHDATGDAAGSGVSWPSGPDAVGPEEIVHQLGATGVRADVVFSHPGDPDPAPQVLFTGPAGSWWVDTDWCAGQPVARPMTAQGIREKVRTHVDGLHLPLAHLTHH